MSSEPILSELPATQPVANADQEAIGHRRRIKVLFVIDNMRLGGTELNAVRTAERLDRERFDLRVVCLSEDGPLTDRYRAIGVPVVNLSLRSFYGWSMLRGGLQFMALLRNARTDIVHAHDVYSNIFTALWAPVARVPVLLASRRWWHSLPNRKLQVGNRFAFRRASAILANSPSVARTVVEETGIAQERVWHIPNFVDERAFAQASTEERRVLHQKWAVPDGSIVLGCVARLHPAKDHPTLLRAFSLAHSRDPRMFLVMIGDGELRSALEETTADLKLTGRVHFAGEIQSSNNLHRGFDISVLASLSEGFPNSLVEAMAVGNPVIATAVGGNVDAVLDGVTGILVPPRDPESLANAMVHLASDAQARMRLGESGLCRAREAYMADQVLQRLESMYFRLLAETAR